MNYLVILQACIFSVVIATYNDKIEDVYLRFYTGTSVSQYVEYELTQSENLLTNTNFNENEITVFYIHGYTENATNKSVNLIVSSYLQARPETNIVLVDWSNLANYDYFFRAIPNSDKVAFAVAMEIRKLLKLGLDLQNIHLIGHSLGGQIVGFIGQTLQKFGYKLKRITALDPAFPGFYSSDHHISANDADFVDIIHTDAGMYGAAISTGTVDFWPNGGFGVQLGCPIFVLFLSVKSFCSHRRSWKYYAESVINPIAFPAVKAWSYTSFKVKNWRPNLSKSFVYMGINANITAKGNYYLVTNSAPPYGKGIDGTYASTKYLFP